MLIGEFAKRGEVSVQTVRFYERHQLLPQPERQPSGYRFYSDSDLRRLHFIRKAKALGFSLIEIRQILSRAEDCGCPCDTVIGLAKQHLATIRQRVKDLQTFEKKLSHAVARWEAQPDRSAPSAFCALIEQSVK